MYVNVTTGYIHMNSMNSDSEKSAQFHVSEIPETWWWDHLASCWHLCFVMPNSYITGRYRWPYYC